MTKPAISIVIPLYNKVSTIQHTISSVLSQTIQDFELIIVDGNSTDGSFEIVSGINDSRIILFKQKGKGVSTARNQGIERASGDIIAFLDADDMWKPDFLETIIRLHTNYPDAGMYGTGADHYIDNQCAYSRVWCVEMGDRELSSYFRDFVEFGGAIIGTSRFASPKSILQEVGMFNEELSIGEDHDLFSRIALYHKVAYSPCICSIYSMGAENNADTVNYCLEVPFEKYWNSISHENISPEKTQDITLYLDYWRINIGGRNIYSGFRKEGREQLSRVSSPFFKPKKYLIYIVSFIPLNLSKIPISKIRKITKLLKITS